MTTDPQQCTVVEDGVRCTNTATRRKKTDVWCDLHFGRAERTGSPLVLKVERRPQGSVRELLDQAAANDGEDCFLVPGPDGGRLSVSYLGKPMTAARAVWAIRHGNDPGEAHVLHTCHRGDEGCVSGGHLYLGDHTQNMVDMVESGRSTHGERHGQHRLTEKQVQDIVTRASAGENQQAIAEEYRIHQSHVSKLKHGHRWWRVTNMNR
ncbi:hypothetical protein [Streptomyces sp. Root369]|uniref:hypothetical protein n=1 Tax=Streptomyces sp. Root369 TaxID=1736523 RepID=UPI00070FA31E|nr:hypothetical protein [Streptomyces sp. Root369]KQW11400.1 hypothetical protein ASD08_35600 [Streptomyces sp. Root369]